MKRNSKMSLALHALGHLGQDVDRKLTSETLAAQNETNSVVVRRVLGQLREAGLVSSEKGRDGGWSLARSPREITVADVYIALGEPFMTAAAKGEDNPPDCKVEAALHHVVDSALADAEALLIGRLKAVTIADISRGFPAM
ncbi:MAG: Rrf2 family transcriptional regulator [Myxococcota bacterium]